MKDFLRGSSLLGTLVTPIMTLAMLASPLQVRAQDYAFDCPIDPCAPPCASICTSDWFIAIGILALGAGSGAVLGSTINGKRGQHGRKGHHGDAGIGGGPGFTGPAGNQGPFGPQGNPGVTGPTGRRGDSGPSGPPGSTGSTGASGFFATGPDVIRFEFTTPPAPTGAIADSIVRGYVVAPNQQTFVTNPLKIASQTDFLQFGSANGEFSDGSAFIGHYTFGYILDQINGVTTNGATGAFPDGIGEIEVTTNINVDNIEYDTTPGTFFVDQQVIFEFTYTPVITKVAPNGVPTPGNNP